MTICLEIVFEFCSFGARLYCKFKNQFKYPLMTQKITNFFKGSVLGIGVFSLAFSAGAQQQIHVLKPGSAPEGYRINRADEQGVQIGFSLNQYSTIPKEINGVTYQNLAVNGMLLQNEAGYPDLPQNSRYIAIPQGSTPVLKVLSLTTESVKNMDIAPAPIIPHAMDDNPLVYEKNNLIYSKNELFPESPVKILSQTKIRGVDVVLLGVSPFQYNPVTKDLIVYKDIQVEISFVGGNGHFGDDAYRSRWWEPVLSDVILNYGQLPTIDANAQIRKNDNMKVMADTGYEYIILIPNAPEFKQWADSVRKFRAEQGILTGIFTMAQIGGTTDADVQTFISDAYANWDIKPAAALILADYGTNLNTTVIAHKYTHMGGFPDFASDNFYADVTGDDLPDIVFSRIVANSAAQLQVMCSKFLNYERNPPTDPNFYSKPLFAMGWQDDRWFQVCSETTSGFLKTLGKTPTRISALGSPASNTGGGVPNTGNWSTNSNTTTVINYFGPTGLNYITAQPGSAGSFSGGTATGVNTAINNGTFLTLHRDHGYYTGWGDPAYSNTSINSLTNINNKLPFVFSVNCQTGAYHHTSEVFVEKMHRYTKNGANSGALGLIGDAETSYSFVNDCMVWGMFDNLWPNFMPAYGTNPIAMQRDKRPAFACASAKYFLQQSSWASSNTKQITYQLYHMFGDAFQWFYSVVPQNLTVSYNPVIGPTDLWFGVSADAGSLISLTIPGPNGPIILGTATGTGAPTVVNMSQPATGTMLVTVTKQDYFRYSGTVTVGSTTSINEAELSGDLDIACYPNPLSHSTNISYLLGKDGNVRLSLVDMMGKEVSVILEGNQSAGTHKVEFSRKDLANGVYSCVLRTDAGIVTKSLVIE